MRRGSNRRAQCTPRAQGRPAREPFLEHRRLVGGGPWARNSKPCVSTAVSSCMCRDVWPIACGDAVSTVLATSPMWTFSNYATKKHSTATRLFPAKSGPQRRGGRCVSDRRQLRKPVPVVPVPGRVGAFGRRVQGRFKYAGNRYYLWVTDPVYERQYLAKLDGDYQIGECFFTVSLGEPYGGACYKLIASIITGERR